MKYFCLFILLFNFNSFSQVTNIEVINKKEIKYYFVYEAINQKTPTDTLLLLGLKEKIKEYDEKIVDLDIGGIYAVETRGAYAVKQSDDIFHLSRLGGRDIVDNVRIANKKGELPILITSYKKTGSFDTRYRYTQKVSIIEVIANQEEFDRKEVAIAGYLVLEFEGTALYLSKEDYLHRITKNAIYVHIGEAFLNEQKFPENWEGEGYVQITGMFTTSFNGHFGMYSGSLLEISHLFFMRDSAEK